MFHSAPICARRGWEMTRLTATLNKVRVELLRKRREGVLGPQSELSATKSKGPFLSLDPNYSMKINICGLSGKYPSMYYEK